MIKIRSAAFETNSSSTHSLIIDTNKSLNPNKIPINKNDNRIHISTNEFGWEIKTYTTQQSKLEYLVTMVLSTIKWSSSPTVEQLNDSIEIKDISDTIAAYAKCDGIYIDSINGYIDHQSAEDFFTVYDFLNYYSLSILEFVYGNHAVLTGNDNN